MAKKRKTNNKVEKCDVSVKTCKSCGCGCGGAAYGLGFIGAAIYYISISSGFLNGVLGVLKALVWPAFLVYEALKFFVA